MRSRRMEGLGLWRRCVSGPHIVQQSSGRQTDRQGLVVYSAWVWEMAVDDAIFSNTGSGSAATAARLGPQT